MIKMRKTYRVKLVIEELVPVEGRIETVAIQVAAQQSDLSIPVLAIIQDLDRAKRSLSELGLNGMEQEAKARNAIVERGGMLRELLKVETSRLIHYVEEAFIRDARKL